MRFKKYFKTALILFLSTVAFFGISYFYLFSSLKRAEKETEQKEQNIPYYEYAENCGILLSFPDEINLLIYLDFTKEISYIININNNGDNSYFGYNADYRIDFTYQTVSLIIDRFGGIDLLTDGQTLRYTGVQVCEILSTNRSPSVLSEILNSVFRKISQYGISNEDFVFIIKNTETDLTVPVCFYWPEYMKNMFSNATFVNWEF